MDEHWGVQQEHLFSPLGGLKKKSLMLDGLIYLSLHPPNDSVGPFTARDHFLSGTLAPTLPQSLPSHWLALGWGTVPAVV